MPNQQVIRCDADYGGNCYEQSCITTGICGPSEAEVEAHKRTGLRGKDLWDYVRSDAAKPDLHANGKAAERA